MTNEHGAASGLYSREQVLRIVGITSRQLAAWEREGWVQSAAPPSSHRSASLFDDAGTAAEPPPQGPFYTFTEIVALRTLLSLRQRQVPAERIRRVLAALHQKLAEVDKPLAELAFVADGRRLGVWLEGAYVEPLTGQLLLDFALGSTRPAKDNVRPLQPASAARLSEAEMRASAEEFFRQGLLCEEYPDARDEAIRAYRKAIVLNPTHVGAWINLGTLYYGQGEWDQAESCYRAALASDPGYALIHFNLGNVHEERGEWEKARECYEQAIQLDPRLADARYNLALVYDRLGLHGRARQQWRQYVQLDPGSPWADFARQQLQNTPLRIVGGGEGTQE